ncbi:MAG: SpaA isopeptide-forming pilin-related protein [Eubacterium sp.]
MKKKISRLIAVLLSVVILLTNAIPAFASLTEGTKYSFTTKYLDAYYDTGSWQTANGHTHDNHGQVALRNLTSTGEPLYCIQIYNAVDSSAAIADNIKDTTVWDKELTESAQIGITRVSIYGYPNYTYGYSAQDAQLATQVLQWEFEIGRRTGYAVKTTAFAEDIFANYPNAKKCYLKIIEACSNHQETPSFSNNTITLKGTGSSNSVTITDTNGVLSNYKIQSVTNNRIKASISGNKLTVYCTGTGALSGRIIFTKDCTDINSSFALTGANQTLFYGTIADPVNAPLTIELSTGGITVHKESEDGDNICDFKIEGNGINKTVKTNSDGLATLGDLPEGTYTVTEVNRSKYYPHTEAKTATVTAGQNSNVYFKNWLIKGTITVFKYGEVFSTVNENDDGTVTPVFKNTLLPNAEFKVYAAEDITVGNIKITKGTLVDTITTVSDGKATTKKLYLNENGTAKYKLVESKSPYGNVIDTEEHIVTLNRGNSTSDISASLKIYNKHQKASVTFEKSLEYDEFFNIGKNNEISSVRFGLYASQKITATDGTAISEGALIEILNYSDTSKAFFAKTDIPFGNYYIQEIATDNHYILDGTKYPFTFSYTNQNDSVVNIKINNGQVIINTLKRGNVQGVKLDDSGNALAGATIGLFPADSEEFTEDTALMTTVSAEDGTFSFSGLAYGKYTVKELIAPNDYLLDENNYPIEIAENEQTVTLEIINVLKRGNIQGVKLDDSGNALAGATIGLFPSGSKEFTEDTALMTTTSAEDGTFSFPELPVGSYIVKELKAPDDYLLDPNSYPIELTENEQIVSLEIVNVLKRGNIQGVKLDDSGNSLAGATIGLFSAGSEEFTEDTALMTTTSAEDGTFSFSKLPVSSYIVKELKAPDEYLLDPNSYPIELTENEQIVSLEITNVLKRGNIQGLKLDDSGNALAGATIGLFPSGSKEFTEDTALMTTTSAEDGTFLFSKLPVGSYIVKELKAPEGYILDNEEYMVNITEDGQIVEVIIVNTMKIGKLTLKHKYSISPKTGADKLTFAISLASAGAIAFASALITQKRKKER